MNIVNILVPNLPESVTEATIISWYKKPGDILKENDVLVDLETDKIVLEIPSLFDGILKSIIENKGKRVISGQTIGTLIKTDSKNDTLINNLNKEINLKRETKTSFFKNHFSPSVRRLVLAHNLKNAHIQGTGVKGRVTCDDVKKHITQKNEKSISDTTYNFKNEKVKEDKYSSRSIERIKMTALRKKISEKLLKTKNNLASLTTFNEVNMESILNLRKKYGELFKKKYQVKLGLMSFCIRAVVEALKQFPKINAKIEGDDIIYYKYFDINIAISTPRGLIAPILKNVDLMSMSDIEKEIQMLALKGKNATLTIDHFKSGNFTITNGGIFGSLFSTPLINYPQSAILGIHAIKERPMVVDGSIKVLPMMYIALTYDHRLIDGQESVGFVLRIKELLEDFNRIILNI
ncbi:dihydrolipoamide succinyltransferase [Buchnera aphidicola (Schlechtendalia chinensis)]|uniref:Dihydrolipoyllysine-residue succinyltransferase component of 2-oxoglutarate dehydrogenase complex n=1 Tax=Buchnera aphidicola subsp. Schlechtendalia chinensis TaxID=118110 RepID=A0A172WDJ9_BUCSC|nr:dihydrolipoyllysine-residue succinyltransferase [Buchnera aphidicola]ANF17060.1 dihydrolipoamide succinyltransferase [Buchnera aphidicola (Schlechtendalia chinensis)]